MRGRVLMLLENNTYPRDSRVRQEAVALLGDGWRVAVICPADKGQPMREVLEGVLVCRFRAPRPGMGRAGYLWEYVYSLLATFVLSLLLWLRPGFDIIHAANPPDTAVFIAGFYRLFGKRFVLDHHDLAPELYLARFGDAREDAIYRLLLRLERWSCRLAHHVIATNESYKGLEMRRDGVPEQRITVVRNGPRLSQLRTRDSCSITTPPGKAVLVYVGMIGFQDGVDYLVRALHHLVYTVGRRDLLCYVVGDGAALPSVRWLASRLGLDNYLTFTGWAESCQVGSYLGVADVCLAPEPSNAINDRSTMIKIVEYMAAGKPIVAFDLPEHRVSAAGAAVYVRPNDETEFARQIALLMDSPSRRRTMGEIGKNRVETELAWEHQERHLLATYRILESQ